MIANKKLLALTLSTMLAAFLLTGCGGGTAENTADQTGSSAESASTADYKGSTVMGKVTAVNNNEITLSIGGGPGRDDKGMKHGNSSDSKNTNGKDQQNQDSDDKDNQAPPDMSSGDKDNQTPPDLPSGDKDNQTPPDLPSEGDDKQAPPDMSSDGKDNKKHESKTLTITIDDESVLQDIALSDITEGTRLSVAFDDEGNVKTVSSPKDNRGPNGKGGRNNTTKTDTTTEKAAGSTTETTTEKISEKTSGTSM